MYSENITYSLMDDVFSVSLFLFLVNLINKFCRDFRWCISASIFSRVCWIILITLLGVISSVIEVCFGVLMLFSLLLCTWCVIVDGVISLGLTELFGDFDDDLVFCRSFCIILA